MFVVGILTYDTKSINYYILYVSIHKVKLDNINSFGSLINVSFSHITVKISN